MGKGKKRGKNAAYKKRSRIKTQKEKKKGASNQKTGKTSDFKAEKKIGKREEEKRKKNRGKKKEKEKTRNEARIWFSRITRKALEGPKVENQSGMNEGGSKHITRREERCGGSSENAQLCMQMVGCKDERCREGDGARKISGVFCV